MVEVNIRSCHIAGNIDLKGLCPDPIVVRGVLVGVYYKVIPFSSMDDDVVEVG